MISVYIEFEKVCTTEECPSGSVKIDRHGGLDAPVIFDHRHNGSH